jgi:Uma2 family endonuclease
VTTLPWSGPFSRSDLELMPDDGHRYELLDGVLLVTPAPGSPHQTAVLELAVLLRASCPPDLKVYVAPFAVVLATDTELQPDVLVARRDDLTARDLRAAPVLATEVLSPSTRRFDLHTKRARYEAAGTPSYWVVDPDEPSLTAWNLVDGGYVEVAHVSGDEQYEARLPFPVRVTPSALVDL